jgi:hypothetical protein
MITSTGTILFLLAIAAAFVVQYKNLDDPRPRESAWTTMSTSHGGVGVTSDSRMLIQPEVEKSVSSLISPNQDLRSSPFTQQHTTIDAVIGNDEDLNHHHHYDTYPDQMYDQNRTAPMSSTRRLSIPSALIGTFYPLTCNANLSLLDCSINKTSTLTLSSGVGDPFTIPCGTCYTFDLGSNVSLPTGLRVMGKLIFPTNYATNIYTPSVLVQGEMVIRSNASLISPDYQSVRFILTGTNDTLLDTSSSDPNILACNNSLCNLGKKPFVVAGGTWS